MHMTEEDTLLSLTELEMQVGTMLLQHEQTDPSFSKTLAGTIYSQNSAGSLDDTARTSRGDTADKKVTLTSEPSEASLPQAFSKPSFIMDNSTLKQN